MMYCTTSFMRQLINNAYGSRLTHASVKFTAENAEKFQSHQLFGEIAPQLWSSTNAKNQHWFYLQGINTSARAAFATILADINLSTRVNKLEQRAGAHATKAAKLWEKADAIKASVDEPQVAINFNFDDDLPF